MAPNEGANSSLPPFSAEARDVAEEHLKFHHDRLAAGSDVVTTIGQYIFILFGAGVIAATRAGAVFVAVPLFWSAWLLHSMQRTRDSIKHETYARHLETRINESLGHPVLMWNRALTGGANLVRTSPTSLLNYIYWFTLNVASWVVAIILLLHSRYWAWAYPTMILGVAVYLGVLYWAVTNDDYKRECERAIKHDEQHFRVKTEG